MRKNFPILEFDPSRRAIIEPRRIVKWMKVPEHCVVCFFGDVMAQVIAETRATVVKNFRWEDGPHPIYEMRWRGKRLAFFHPGIGSSLSAALLDDVIALGCHKFIACGGAGVLNREIAVGHIVVPKSAVRDEGVSYHYLPPSREVNATSRAVVAIKRTLRAHQVDFVVGKTWTTDAPYRETIGKVKLRHAEGCLTVEMEAAAFFAVAKFRRVVFGQMLYGGDDVSSEKWDSREWNSHSVREKLFWLAAEACLAL